MAARVTDSIFIKHIPCPHCHSRDNRGVYSDGHEYCFGCTDYKPPEMTNKVVRKIMEKMYSAITSGFGCPPLPDDAECALLDGCSSGLLWLKKYGLTNGEISQHCIKWSKSQQQIIFPFYDDEWNVLAWQARNFSINSCKYMTAGSTDNVLPILGLTTHEEKDIILVEDMVSAIKVSRHYRAMPLLGSSASHRKLGRLCFYTDTVRFWLDADKLNMSIKMSKALSQMNIKTSIIHTERDPKEYSDAEILAYGRI